MAGWQPVGFGSTVEERPHVDEAFLPGGGEHDSTELDERAGRDDLAAYRRGRRRARTRRLATGAAGLVGLALVWQIAASILRDPVFLPSVTQTAATLLHYLNRPYPAQGSPLWYDAFTSLRRILVGFAVGVAAGVTLGAAMSASRVIRHLVDPVIEVLRPLPPLAFIPLFIIWFGIGELPKVVLIIIGVTPIMVVASIAALDEVPQDLLLCARTLGASRLYTLLHVHLRSALPGILTGMRISMAAAWTSIVAAELHRGHQRPRLPDPAGG